MAAIWEIWLQRNTITFREENAYVDQLMEGIKRRSSEWFTNYAKNSKMGLVFSSWHQNPTNCILTCY
jgi:hypothetical protein